MNDDQRADTPLPACPDCGHDVDHDTQCPAGCPMCLDGREAAADSLRSVEPAAAEPPADVRKAVAEAFVAAVEGYGVADTKGTDPMFFVDIMLGTLREKGVVLDRAAQPPRGSLTDPVREHFEEWGVHMCDSTHLAGG